MHLTFMLIIISLVYIVKNKLCSVLSHENGNQCSQILSKKDMLECARKGFIIVSFHLPFIIYLTINLQYSTK